MWSFQAKLVASLVAVALGAGTTELAPKEKSEPVFIEGSQYTAVLDQRTHHWRLMPLDGHGIEVSNSDALCAPGPALPEGVWLVTRDAQGRAELLAPSTTKLPRNHPGAVALVACGETSDGGKMVSAPRVLIDWLASNTGAIYVQN